MAYIVINTTNAIIEDRERIKNTVKTIIASNIYDKYFTVLNCEIPVKANGIVKKRIKEKRFLFAKEDFISFKLFIKPFPWSSIIII